MELLHGKAPENVVVPDPGVVLDSIGALLAQDDAAANALITAAKTLLRNTFGTEVEQPGQQVEVFDYPAVLTTIESLSACHVVAISGQLADE